MATKRGRKPDERDYATRVAERIIEQLEQGIAPWQKPWEPGQLQLPTNASTGKAYRGGNSLWLLMQGYEDPRWMTYRQADAAGAQVRKGEKGTPIQYWKTEGSMKVLGADGKPVLDEQGKEKSTTVQYTRPRPFGATVFNAAQIDGLEPLPAREVAAEWERHQRADFILEASGVPIQHVEGNRAFYSPTRDSITLPMREQFQTADRYYATALHELGHSTGHPSRLSRDLSDPFGSEGYAKEELRAEIASLMLGERLGIGHDPGQHAAYVGSWIKALKEDPKEIFRAATDAEKIAGFVIDLEQKKEQERNSMQQNAPERDSMQPERMTLSQFRSESRVVSLENNGRQWEVSLGEHFHAFSDAATPEEAIADVHHAAVNNVIFLNSPQAMDAGLEKPAWPPQNVLDEYPKLAALKTAIEDADKARAADEALEQLRRQVQTVKDGIKIADEEGLSGKQRLDAVLNHLAQHNGTTLDETRSDRFVSETFVPSIIEDHDRKQREMMPRIYSEPEPASSQASPYEDLFTAARKADDAYQSELERVYGAEAPNARYQLKHADTDVQTAADAKKAADRLFHDATQAAQKKEADMAMPKTEKTYLAVPFKDKDEAKKAGAKWDKAQKSWFAPEGISHEPLQRWMQDRSAEPSAPKLTPKEEFAQALEDAGFILNGEPKMDGSRQRLQVKGDGANEKSGAYKAFEDGHPAGWIQNWKSGEKTNWKWSGTASTVTPEDRARIAQEQSEKLALRQLQETAKQERTAKAIEQLIAVAPFSADHPYLADKRIKDSWQVVPQDASDLPMDTPIRIAKDSAHAMEIREQQPDAIVLKAGALLVPVHDENGKIMSAQWIDETGRKGFAAGGAVAGGHLQNIRPGTAQDKPIIIAEGRATAATISNATGATTFTAFTAGNLLATALAARAAYPDRAILIAGDNDHHKPRELDPRTGQPKKNVGKEAAEEAAKAVGGYAAVPLFDKESKGTDWNDFEKENGNDALKKALDESMILADRRRLADAHMTEHDGERVAEVITMHKSQVESKGQGKGATQTDAVAAYQQLQRQSSKERDRQDKSDELDPEEEKKKSRGRARSR